MQWGKNSLFKNAVGKTGQLYEKEIKQDYSLILTYEDKLKWIKDLNVKPNTINILEGNIGGKLFDIGLSNIFNMSLEAWKTKTKINKWD